MHEPGKDWENLCLLTGSPDRVLLVGFGPEAMKPLTGKTLAEVAKMRGKDWVDTALDLLVESDVSIGSIFFLMSEDNVKKQIRLPWVSFGSDAGSEAPEGVFLKSQPHPRAYGNFANVLAKSARRRRPLTDAIRALEPAATNLGLDHRLPDAGHVRRRGRLRPRDDRRKATTRSLGSTPGVATLSTACTSGGSGPPGPRPAAPLAAGAVPPPG
jgi:N-acyl-D-aspartate/D-glutamate deacylase